MTARPVSRVGITVIAAAALTLAGCSQAATEQGASSVSSAASSAMESAATEASDAMTASGVEVQDGYIKSKPADKTLTAIFGTIVNNTDEEITITSFSSSLSNVGKYEIHETVDGSMQVKESGITIPAGGSHELKPGGDHFMLMEVTDPIEAGDTVNLTLLTADGQEIDVPDLPVRTISSGEEDYSTDGGVEGNNGMEPQQQPSQEHHNH